MAVAVAMAMAMAMASSIEPPGVFTDFLAMAVGLIPL